ncbi:unnamed protein product [Rotaria sp. Silwood2]|nr:unnamed protein product [Rotaria sp. Silwood2]CAF3383977.1 unnamed protein product [Rotaria sp. Silwood2]CAF4281602.1 unnamed protein product [Rotaria sp. Silwood2]
MEGIQVAQYVSDLSDEEVNKESNEKPQKKKKRTKYWVKEAVFDNAGEAEASLGNAWSKHYTNYSEIGRKVYYRCELEQWCKQNVDIPTDENKYFVVSYKIIYDDEEDDDEEDINGNIFRVFLSSVRLLNIASISSHVHADATYKLIWQGFPVLVIGTTDLKKVFHPFGLAICSNEQTKDFEFIFNSVQIGLEKINKNLLKPSALISDVADSIKNGFKNWKMNNRQKNQSIIEFLNYFDNEWIQTNGGWYEGIQLYTPSTNNALEATNKVIKDDGTFRERHVLSRFLVVASNIINNWSIERDPSSINTKLFATEPTICLNLWTTSYQWAKSSKNVICIKNDVSNKYYIPAGNLESISQGDLNKYVNKKWTTFNQFMKSFDIWCVEIKNDSDWKTSRCTCPAFLKNYICKHIIGMSIRLKLCKPPPAAKNVPIGEKRKRGRPAKARRALLMQ